MVENLASGGPTAKQANTGAAVLYPVGDKVTADLFVIAVEFVQFEVCSMPVVTEGLSCGAWVW